MREPSEKALEKQGEETVKQLIKNDKQITADTFIQVIKDGAKEFKAKTGRELTYSEMREMYG